MAGLGEDRLLQYDADASIRNSLAAALSEYCRSAEEFQCGLKQSASDYGLMLVKQHYLLDVAAIVRSISVIVDCQETSLAASRFGSAAWSYLDESDWEAFLKHKIVLSGDLSHFLRSRLEASARAARRIAAISSIDLENAADIKRSTLGFLLGVILELPIGAWECAPCLAMSGNCRDCVYGRAHGICSHPESDFAILHGSREDMLCDIRRKLNETSSIFTAENLPQGHEHEAIFGSADKPSFSQRENDICEEYDLVGACD